MLEFIKTEDDTTYYIKVKVTDEYVTKTTKNGWDITCTSVLPAEISRAKYSIEQSDSSGYVFLKICMQERMLDSVIMLLK